MTSEQIANIKLNLTAILVGNGYKPETTNFETAFKVLVASVLGPGA